MLQFTQFAVDNFTDAAYWIREDSSLLYVNDAACTMLGYTREELLAKRVYELNPAIDVDTWPLIWKLLKEEGKRTFEGEHIAKDGRVIPVEISANLVVFDGEEFSCAFTRDISTRKQLEQRLRQAEKMDAIGRLAGGVAHDFNNQLAGILGYAELLEMEVEDRPRGLELVRSIHRLVERASGLTSQLLAFARKGNYRAVGVDVHGLVDEVADLLSHSLDQKVQVHKELGADEHAVLGDPSQLQAAILNLALNARDAMPDGGELTLATDNVSLDAEESIRQPFSIQPGDYLRITVRDTGRGMSPDVLARVFEPFYTTKEMGKGTGLGLAAVYGTVQNHGGAVHIESTPSRGTEAWIFLPLAEEPLEPKPVGSDGETPLCDAHVLVVDDEADLRAVAKELLGTLGCTVTLFERGQDAVAWYQDSHAEVDLVLLDMCMPHMDGAETFRALKRISPDLKVLLISGHSLGEDVRALLQEGARGFLQKPFSKKTIAEQLRRILN